MVSPGNLLRTTVTLFGPNGHIPHAVRIRLRICTLTNAGEDTVVSVPRAAQEHDVFCQPYPAVQIR